MEIYLVGGAVRDELLGYPFTERDWVVVGADPETMTTLKYRPVGKDFPVFLHPDTGEEYALARTERKSGPGYKGFIFHTGPDVTLEDDLIRRDITINAMAKSPSGRIIDPHGGRRDLEQKLLRHVSPAFAEDPLRVLRVARFAARYHHLGFVVAAETMGLMRTLAVSGELQHLTPERVWTEIQKALAEPSPRTFFEVLRQCGALCVILPEVDRLFGIPQRADFHPEIDTGLHTLMSVEQAGKISPDPKIRFCALVHDLGKGTTSPEILPRHIGHEERGIPLVHKVCDRLRIPNEYRELAIPVTRLHLLCHKAFELKPVTILKIYKAADAFRKPERFELFLQAVEADARGRKGFEDEAYVPGQWLRELLPRLLAINSQDILARGISGKAVGEALDREREKVIKQFKQTRLASADSAP
jgi:tRNA nucleotidyltransferase (CCA-adding enzyme)